MKLHTLAASALLLAGIAFTGGTANAALTYSTGDLLLGFRALGGTGSNKDYVVNLGQYTQFTSASSSFTVGTFGTDLTSAFGSSWNTDRGEGNNVQWGIIGTPYSGGANNTKIIYVTAPQSGIAPLGKSPSNQTNTISNINTVVSGFLGSAENAAASNATIQLTSDPGNWNSEFQFVSNLDFNIYSEIEGNFVTGLNSADAILNLYQLNPVNNSTGILVGSFGIGSGGAVTFTPTAVPEPSTTALGLMAVIGLAIFFHRRNRQNS